MKLLILIAILFVASFLAVSGDPEATTCPVVCYATSDNGQCHYQCAAGCRKTGPQNVGMFIEALTNKGYPCRYEGASGIEGKINQSNIISQYKSSLI
ncbi:hypothetical protein DFA_01477 [Cavenderia fasciculata]|uniref:Uncharacterized protein n=1 Tax=Cavenderia fasciculata TaxID=261658 RepID=F4PT15_CACFS|nr:uncharacterized protein DFA_01477 [Cavenderia fasciculata]EGG21591.1 hypothetical protein DFA_01477 [Cavenderia fasciculata]|eukprot:XP_004359441.1 hypothetical protein DFA_01477 [Cavenderia fasciculata]